MVLFWSNAELGFIKLVGLIQAGLSVLRGRKCDRSGKTERRIYLIKRSNHANVLKHLADVLLREMEGRQPRHQSCVNKSLKKKRRSGNDWLIRSTAEVGSVHQSTDPDQRTDAAKLIRIPVDKQLSGRCSCCNPIVGANVCNDPQVSTMDGRVH